MSEQHGLPVICLMGPTASGKTDVAARLYKTVPCEIISVDSAQVYRGMDIGTAKPTAVELEQTPHRLIDIRDPNESYSAGDFVRDAMVAIAEIHTQNKIPLLVGGTMLYFWRLQNGFAELPPANEAMRDEINDEIETKGLAVLYEELTKIDPDTAARIHQNDSQRIQRAIEVYRITGKPMSAFTKEEQIEFPYKCINWILTLEDRKQLHERIESRFIQMIADDLIGEVTKLYDRGDLNISMPAIRMVGYRQVWDYLAGEYDYDMMLHKGIVATRQLAKRQYTWLRRFEDATWFDAEDPLLMGKLLERFPTIII